MITTGMKTDCDWITKSGIIIPPAIIIPPSLFDSKLEILSLGWYKSIDFNLPYFYNNHERSLHDFDEKWKIEELGLCLGDTPSFDPPFQKSNEIADFVGKIKSKCGSNKGVSKIVRGCHKSNRNIGLKE